MNVSVGTRTRSRRSTPGSGSAAEFARYEPLVAELFKHYESYFL